MNGSRMATIVAFLVMTMTSIGCFDDDDRSAVVIDTVGGNGDTAAEVVDTTDDLTMSSVTLPLLNALLNDSAFVRTVAEDLDLTEAEIDSLRRVSFDAAHELDGADDREDGYAYGAADAARRRTLATIDRIIGPEKGKRLLAMAQSHWMGGGYSGMAGSTNGADSGSAFARTPNSVPRDTRIVVNVPAYRMDLFDGGNLVVSYDVAIGYPEFPLPVGLRTAKEIIFNPTWTPPDESWVEGSKSVRPGKTVEAGSKLNPLGIAKIPIGLPSLIHGGKAQSKIGTFGSHGCVGLTDEQMRAFAVQLAEATGTQGVSDSLIKSFGKKRSETKTIGLGRAIPVELRYETIVAQDGELYIYRDVYDFNTNTEARLRGVLAAHGISMEQLTEQERARVTDALNRMARDASGRSDSASVASKDDSAGKKSGGKSITRSVKGEKMVMIPIAALRGKGYPAPADETPRLAHR